MVSDRLGFDGLPRRTAATLCVIGAVALVGCGSDGSMSLSPSELGLASQRLVGAELDTEHTAVLAVLSETGGGAGLCTGTLIAPNLVLTAQHCVVETVEREVDCAESRFGAPLAPGRIGVTPFATLRASTRFFPVAEVVLPGDDALCGNDIALLVLGGKFDIDSVPAMSPRLDDPVTRGETYTAVGF